MATIASAAMMLDELGLGDRLSYRLGDGIADLVACRARETAETLSELGVGLGIREGGGREGEDGDGDGAGEFHGGGVLLVFVGFCWFLVVVGVEESRVL